MYVFFLPRTNILLGHSGRGRKTRHYIMCSFCNQITSFTLPALSNNTMEGRQCLANALIIISQMNPISVARISHLEIYKTIRQAFHCHHQHQSLFYISKDIQITGLDRQCQPAHQTHLTKLAWRMFGTLVPAGVVLGDNLFSEPSARRLYNLFLSRDIVFSCRVMKDFTAGSAPLPARVYGKDRGWKQERLGNWRLERGKTNNDTNNTSIRCKHAHTNVKFTC